eukprot:5765709-Amphidinium_carterae.3
MRGCRLRQLLQLHVDMQTQTVVQDQLLKHGSSWPRFFLVPFQFVHIDVCRNAFLTRNPVTSVCVTLNATQDKSQSMSHACHLPLL